MAAKKTEECNNDDLKLATFQSFSQD